MSLYSYMLFRDKEGQLVELLRCKFTSDTDYYRAIIGRPARHPTSLKQVPRRNKIVDIIKRKR